MANETNYARPEEAKEKVIKGTARVEKPKFGKKMIDFLFSDKLDSVAAYLTNYILGPSLKDLIFKMGTGALQMALFGGNTMSSGGTYVPGYGYQPVRRDMPTPYNMMANPNYAQPQPGPYQQRVSLNDISFDTRDDAQIVLDRMNREISRYGKVRVADFYTFAGITGQESNWTLQGCGWYSLAGVYPEMRTDGRWMIRFPPVQTI